MKRWRTLFVVVLVMSAPAIVRIACLGPREPVYDGKTLSQWLLNESRLGSEAGKERAVRAIGTNAAPFLLTWMQYEMPPWRRAVLTMAERASPVMERVWPRFQGTMYRPTELAAESIDGFRILGSDAETALPELARLMKGTNLSAAVRALYAVHAMGDAGLPAMLDVVTNRKAYIQSSEFYPFFIRHSQNELVVPILIRSLKERDPQVAAAAARAFDGIGPQVGVVKALTNAVAEATDANVRRWAIYSLGRMGADSIPAVPCLVRALSDSNEDVRSAATNALRTLSVDTMRIVKAP